MSIQNLVSTPWNKRSAIGAGVATTLTVTTLVSGALGTSNKDLEFGSSLLIGGSSILLILETLVIAVKSRIRINYHFEVDEKASDLKTLQLHYFDIAKNPLNYCEQTSQKLILKDFELSECACISFDRSRNERRTFLENKIVDFFTSFYEKNERISLLSLGSGQLLQDWIIVVKLVEKGFKKISLTFVDPNLKQENVSRFIESLQIFPEVDFQFSTAQSIQTPSFKLKHFRSSYDAIYALDFDGLLNAYTIPSFFKNMGFAVKDLSEVFQYLSSKGQLFFSSYVDMIFSKTKISEIANIKEVARNVSESICKVIPEGCKNLKVGCEDSCWEILLPTLNALDKQTKIDLSNVTVYYEKDFVYDRAPAEVTMLKRAFPELKIHMYENENRPKTLDIVLVAKENPSLEIEELEEKFSLDFEKKSIIYYLEKYRFTTKIISKKI